MTIIGPVLYPYLTGWAKDPQKCVNKHGQECLDAIEADARAACNEEAPKNTLFVKEQLVCGSEVERRFPGEDCTPFGKIYNHQQPVCPDFNVQGAEEFEWVPPFRRLLTGSEPPGIDLVREWCCLQDPPPEPNCVRAPSGWLTVENLDFKPPNVEVGSEDDRLSFNFERELQKGPVYVDAFGVVIKPHEDDKESYELRPENLLGIKDRTWPSIILLGSTAPNRIVGVLRTSYVGVQERETVVPWRGSKNYKGDMIFTVEQVSADGKKLLPIEGSPRELVFTRDDRLQVQERLDKALQALHTMRGDPLNEDNLEIVDALDEARRLLQNESLRLDDFEEFAVDYPLIEIRWRGEGKGIDLSKYKADLTFGLSRWMVQIDSVQRPWRRLYNTVVPRCVEYCSNFGTCNPNPFSKDGVGADKASRFACAKVGDKGQAAEVERGWIKKESKDPEGNKIVSYHAPVATCIPLGGAAAVKDGQQAPARENGKDVPVQAPWQVEKRAPPGDKKGAGTPGGQQQGGAGDKKQEPGGGGASGGGSGGGGPGGSGGGGGPPQNQPSQGGGKPSPRCGNRVIDDGEDCDDGNKDNLDGCRNDCTKPKCGDGIKDKDEQCDDGNSDNLDACRNDCKEPACGDGIKDAGEECDAGPKSVPGCNRACRFPFCGDGEIQKDRGEECDNGSVCRGTERACSREADCRVCKAVEGTQTKRCGANPHGPLCTSPNDCSGLVGLCIYHTQKNPRCGTSCTLLPLCGGIVLPPGKICVDGTAQDPVPPDSVSSLMSSSAGFTPVVPASSQSSL